MALTVRIVRASQLCATLAFALLLFAAPAHAAFPGTNGKIAYLEDPCCRLMTINPNGSGQATTNRQGLSPSWSPDGKRVVYRADEGGLIDKISVMNPDGSAKVDLGASGEYPAWSPDQAKIAFDRQSCDSSSCWNNIYVMNADGSGTTRVPFGEEPTNYVLFPSWSPEGAWIAFSGNPSGHPYGIYKVRPDGSDLTLLFEGGSDPDWAPDGTKIVFVYGANGTLATIDSAGGGFAILDSPTGEQDIYPAWSPDGTKIVFATFPLSGGGLDKLYVVNADGTGRTFLGVQGSMPSWQPVQPGYARPKGATPLRASLVVAFKPCTAPNEQHGGPLDVGSCQPPNQASDFLTVGTPPQDPAAAVGSMRADVRAGNPSTPADEADVSLRISITDVRNKSDLSDYAGELAVTSSRRITDQDNTPAPDRATGAATTQDTPLSITVPCAPTTADTTIGSLCALSTTADAIVPGQVPEGMRSNWELGQVLVNDGGADGVAATTTDNTLFMDEGIFIP